MAAAASPLSLTDLEAQMLRLQTEFNERFREQWGKGFIVERVGLEALKAIPPFKSDLLVVPSSEHPFTHGVMTRAAAAMEGAPCKRGTTPEGRPFVAMALDLLDADKRPIAQTIQVVYKRYIAGERSDYRYDSRITPYRIDARNYEESLFSFGVMRPGEFDTIATLLKGETLPRAAFDISCNAMKLPETIHFVRMQEKAAV